MLILEGARKLVAKRGASGEAMPPHSFKPCRIEEPTDPTLWWPGLPVGDELLVTSFRLLGDTHLLIDLPPEKWSFLRYDDVPARASPSPWW